MCFIKNDDEFINKIKINNINLPSIFPISPLPNGKLLCIKVSDEIFGQLIDDSKNKKEIEEKIVSLYKQLGNVTYEKIETTRDVLDKSIFKLLKDEHLPFILNHILK